MANCAAFPQLGTGNPIAMEIGEPNLKQGGLMQTRLNPAHPEFGKLSMPEIEERIRNRAYDLFQQRGCGNDHALDDWLEAKSEVLGISSSPQEDVRSA
jgi:Protein of unknown function (DUF2934)